MYTNTTSSASKFFCVFLVKTWRALFCNTVILRQKRHFTFNIKRQKMACIKCLVKVQKLLNFSDIYQIGNEFRSLLWNLKSQMYLIMFIIVCWMQKFPQNFRHLGKFGQVYTNLDKFKQIWVGWLEPSCCVRSSKKVPTKKLFCGIDDIWRSWIIPNWS